MGKKFLFKGQSEGEKVLYMWGRHPFTLIPEEAAPCLLIVASVVVMTYFYGQYIIFLGAFILFFFFSVWAFYAYFVWAGDRYIVTDHRVVDIDQLGLFTRAEKEAPLDRIQDITIQVNGFWASLLRYGNVIVMTASDNLITLSDVPNPGKVQNIISDLNKATIQARSGGKDEILSRIEALVDEYKKSAASESPDPLAGSGGESSDSNEKPAL